MSLSFGSTGHYGVVVTITADDPPQAIYVELDASVPENEEWVWAPQPSPPDHTFPLPGNAAVTKSAKTYQITGNISPTEGIDPKPKGSPVPFEANVTCP